MIYQILTRERNGAIEQCSLQRSHITEGKRSSTARVFT